MRTISVLIMLCVWSQNRFCQCQYNHLPMPITRRFLKHFWISLHPFFWTILKKHRKWKPVWMQYRYLFIYLYLIMSKIVQFYYLFLTKRSSAYDDFNNLAICKWFLPFFEWRIYALFGNRTRFPFKLFQPPKWPKKRKMSKILIGWLFNVHIYEIVETFTGYKKKY